MDKHIESKPPINLSQFWFGPYALALAALLIAVMAGAITYMYTIKFVELAVLALGGAIVMGTLIVKDQYAWLAGILVVVGLFIDWYGLIDLPYPYPVYAAALAMVVVAAILLKRLAQRELAFSAQFWLWISLLILAIPPIFWSLHLSDGVFYYVGVFFGPMLLYFVGMQMSRNMTQVRRLLNLLAALGALIGVHTIIAGKTGQFLLLTSKASAYLASANNFTVAGGTAIRVGSFFGNPDWNGAFLAMIVFLPAGLFFTTSSRSAKMLYLAEIALIMLALLYTVTASSWIAVAIGLVLFYLLVIRGHKRVWLPALFGLALIASYILLPHEFSVLNQHIHDTSDALLRFGAWETASKIIASHPFNGLGLDLNTYLLRAEPYRVPLQYRPLAHPHDSYLELAALAGIQVLIAFLALLGVATWRAFRTYRWATPRYRPLLGGALTAILVLTMNSVTINGWTLSPLAYIGWLILGAISSATLGQAAPKEEES
ncbi:MAG TPA: O-antigen ligase family protein [Ktedonosporobacter sp.]|nr:O-antigen ligase family protein [Ktedonosporobacter sp.]